MLLKEEYLIIINSKNRIQRIRLQLDHNPYNKIYSIFRITGQYGGKETYQPPIQIQFGKVKRTAAEQAVLQYNGLLKKYLDKGYVNLNRFTTKKYEELSEEELKGFLGGNFVSDQLGIPKPMLAKLADQCSSDIWEKNWYVSRKLDGEPKNLCRR